MNYTCISCQSDLLVNDNELTKRIEPNQQIVFCQKCKKKELLIGSLPANVELREDRDTLSIIHREPRGHVAWMGMVVGVLTAVSVVLWTLPSNKWIEMAAFMLSLFAATFIPIWFILFFAQTKLRIIYGSASAAPSDPFRGEVSPVGYSIEIYQATVFRKREVVLLESIQQVYCTREVRTPHKGPAVSVYHVEAILKTGVVVPLMKEIWGLEAAQYIEAKIESFLKIEDVEVSGEVTS